MSSTNQKKDRLGLRIETKWEFLLAIIWIVATPVVIFTIPFPYDIIVVVYVLISMWLIEISAERAYKMKNQKRSGKS
jgi:Flp pilus assembly protein TadB